jgi:response regulator of citrate/malate metabolism
LISETNPVPSGFEVAGVVAGGRDALRFLHGHAVDVVLLDFNLPDIHGLEVCRALRAAGSTVDVIAVTSARDLATVRSAVSQGIVQYLLKPFTFRSLREKLERYAEFREKLVGGGVAAGQGEVDRAFAALRGADRGTLPTGLAEETLEAVAWVLQQSSGGLSAGEVGQRCGVSRVTARPRCSRYRRKSMTSSPPPVPQDGDVPSIRRWVKSRTGNQACCRPIRRFSNKSLLSSARRSWRAVSRTTL